MIMPQSSTAPFFQILGPLWTVNVSGPERHDGDKPYSYTLHADSLADAKLGAWLHHLWYETSEKGMVAADGTVPAWPEEKNQTLRSSDWADVVVIDCPQYRCIAGPPFLCSDLRHHWDPTFDRTECECAWYWQYIMFGLECDNDKQCQISELGYMIPRTPSQETTW